jgi:hypothetical protein
MIAIKCDACGKTDKPTQCMRVRIYALHQDASKHDTFAIDRDVCPDCYKKILEVLKHAK